MKFPAGSGEKAQYLVRGQNDTTMRFILRYPILLDPTILSQAVYALIDGVDVLHSRLYADKRSFWWETMEVKPEACFVHLRAEGDPMEIGRQAALEAILPEEPKLRVILVEGREESVLVLLVSHLVADGGDGKYLLQKLTEGYELIRRYQTVEPLKIKNGSRDPEQAYRHMTKEQIKPLMRNPVSVRSSFPYPDDDPGEKRMVWAMIPAEKMHAARKKAKLLGGTVNDLLLAGFYRAYGQLPGVEKDAPMGIVSMADVRKLTPAGDSLGLANMSGSMPTSLQKLPESFEETLQAVIRQTAAFKQHPENALAGLPLIHMACRRLSPGIMMKAVPYVYRNLSLGLTNLGNIDGSSLVMNGVLPSEGIFGGPLKKKPGMQISAASLDGNCCLAVVGQFTEKDAATLQRVLDGIAGEIESYIKK